MKNKILIISIVTLLFGCAGNIHKDSTTQFSSVTVFYKNGDSLNGRANYPIHFNETEIYLKPRNKGYKKIKATEIEKVVYDMPDKQQAVFNKFFIADETISKTKNKFQFLELISKGNVNLYYGHNAGFLYVEGKKKKFLQKTRLFYCKRNNESDLTLIYATTDQENSDQKYAAIAKKYFGNEPEIANKINQEVYNPEKLIELIQEYNKEIKNK
jgi:hypothetical protein